MPQDYIILTDDKPRAKARGPSLRLRTPTAKSGDTIELVESTSSYHALSHEGQPSIGSSSGDAGKKNSEARPQKAKERSASDRLPQAPAPEPASSIEFGDTLPKCQTVEEVREWLVSQQRTFNEKVERGYNWRKMPDEMCAQAAAILNDVGAVSAFTMNNDHLSLEAFEMLRNHISGYLSADPANELALITFIPGEGGTSMDRPVIDVRESRKRVNDVMRKMAPHWLGVTDLAFFSTIQHPAGGLHLQDHKHVLAWGKDFIESARVAAAKNKRKFKANVTNLPVIKVVRASDGSEVNIARLCAYLLKAPAKGKNWFEYPDGRQIMNHTEAKDRYIQFLRLAQIRSLLTLEDVIFGGADGIAIRGSMVKDMRGRAKADARGKHAMHPDVLSTFWADFNKELGQDHWAIPAIIRR